uniref:Replication factor A1 n=1 Tax=Tetraselmis sp. GSL018 TaxID=582737 RepID=A0A061RWI8_9CHLO|eukprot:CAMPEP_0177607906 /NCGR_PEP_ID=MMETSP0419_2-20121207/18176_1 /TAXON_ID=582737 /ORGANISM="Tetraselmis sp., Strain GSL018" /LENGTH=145 /DNA_ID=CAMNT_0019102537 /DNA_START=90 /DNA_END=527 /DNA_ORIENTATION=-
MTETVDNVQESANSQQYIPPPGPASTVAELRPGTEGHNLTLKVISSKNVRTGRGTSAGLSEAIVGDETGVIVMTCRQGQVDIVKPGNVISVKEGFVTLFKGSMRLSADPKNPESVTKADDPPSIEPNTQFNVSMIEYEIVQAEQK